MKTSKLLNSIDHALIAAIQARGLATALDEIVMDIGGDEPIPEERLDSLYAISNALLAACKDTADKLNAAALPTEKHKRHSELPECQKIDIRRRLDLSAQRLGTVSPKTITDDQGSPTREFLSYAKENAVSLDWLVCGDTSGLRKDLLDVDDVTCEEQRSRALKLAGMLSKEQAGQAIIALERVLGT